MDQFEELARGMATELQATFDKIRAKVAGDLSDSMSQIVTDQIKEHVFTGWLFH